MGAEWFLLIVVVVVVVGSVVVYLRNRPPSSLEAGIDEFRREMQARAPREAPLPPRRRGRRRG